MQPSNLTPLYSSEAAEVYTGQGEGRVVEDGGRGEMEIRLARLFETAKDVNFQTVAMA